MKKIHIFTVVALLVALVVPAHKVHAGTIIGIQGGYIQLNAHSISTDVNGVKTALKRKTLKNTADIRGGYAELNFDKTFNLGKMLYVGAGLYFQWAGTKNIVWTGVVKQKLTHNVAVGPEIVIGFNIIPILEFSVRGGIGLAVSIGPKPAVGDRINRYGLNWRVLPGLTFKFGKIGVFVEGGYVGNWLQHVTTVATITTKTGITYHGGQIGAGVKLYL